MFEVYASGWGRYTLWTSWGGWCPIHFGSRRAAIAWARKRVRLVEVPGMSEQSKET